MNYTKAQILGVTDTSDAETSPQYLVEPRGHDDDAWTEDLETAIYGEQDWILPGTGAEGSGCGTWYPKEFCDTNGHVHLGKHQCGNRSCPNCWSNLWARPRTVNVVSRLGAAREVSHPRLVHLAVSPPEGSIDTKQAFYDGHRTAYRIAKEHGVRGGVLVPHGYRVAGQAREAFRAEVKVGKWNPKEDGGIWRWVREHDTHWRDLTYWSPHYHIIGLSRDVKPSNPDADDGWILKNMKRGDSYGFSNWNKKDRDAYDDMAAAVRYILSHATFEKGASRQAIRWFGVLHSTKFCPDPEDAEDRKTEPDLGPLSKGTWNTIQRYAEEVVGGESDRSGSADEREQCDRDGCDGELHPIWDAREFLDQRGDRLETTQYDRLLSAYLWATGDIEPPPGMKNPRTEQQALEVMAHISS